MSIRHVSIPIPLRTILIAIAVFATIVGIPASVTAREQEAVYAAMPTVSNWSLREFIGGKQVGREVGPVFGASVSSLSPWRNYPLEFRWEAEGILGFLNREEVVNSNGHVDRTGRLYGARSTVDLGWSFDSIDERNRKTVEPFIGGRALFITHPPANADRSKLLSLDGRFGCRIERQFGRLANRHWDDRDAVVTASAGFHLPLLTGGDATGGTVAPFAEVGARFGIFQVNQFVFSTCVFYESIRLKGGANGADKTEADRVGLRLGWEF